MSSFFSRFLLFSSRVLSLIVFLFTFGGNLAIADDHPFAILQGASSDKEVQISIQASIHDEVVAHILGPANELLSFEQSRRYVPSTDQELLTLKVQNLSPEVTYRLVVRSRKDLKEDVRTFRSLNVQKKNARIAAFSCSADVFHNSAIWLELAAQKPDLLISTGDIVYLDRANLLRSSKPRSAAEVWRRHSEARNKLGLYRWSHLVPLIGTWDDHDFGFNNVVPPWELAEAAFEAYEAFIPRREISGVFEKGPKMASLAHLFGQKFVLLDNRSFQGLDAQARQYGIIQEQWLKGLQLGRSAILVSGSQFFGGYLKKDSYEWNYPEDFFRFQSFLRTFNTEFVFLSGDIHFSEVMSLPEEILGYHTYEITSSPMHSGTFPGRHLIKQHLGAQNPYRIGATSTFNFIILDFLEAEKVKAEAKIISWRGRVLFNTSIDLNQSNIYDCQKWLEAQSSSFGRR